MGNCGRRVGKPLGKGGGLAGLFWIFVFHLFYAFCRGFSLVECTVFGLFHWIFFSTLVVFHTLWRMGWRFIGFVGAICAVFQGVRVWNFCIWLVWKSMGKVFFSRGKLCGQILGAFSFHHFHRVSCKSFFFLPFYKKRKAYIFFILFGILLGIVEKGDFCEVRLRLGKAK